MPKLVFTDPKFAGMAYEFVREKTRVGRADDNLLVIRDASVSATHCEILVNGQEVIVRDLDSRNGTFVNGSRLKGQQAQVKSGGSVRFGTVEARIEMELPHPYDDATEITAVHAYGRAMQERGAPKPPAPDHGATIEPSAPEDTEGRTILMPHPATTASMAENRTVALPQAAAKAPSRRGRWVVTLLVAAGLAVLVWLLWLRR